MNAKGVTSREILTVFPELTLEDISTAVLQAADLMKDPEASLTPLDPSVQAILEKARRHSNLSDDEAMELAVAEGSSVAAFCEPRTVSASSTTCIDPSLNARHQNTIATARSIAIAGGVSIA